MNFCTLPVTQDERRPPFTERDLRRSRHRQRGCVAPKRGARPYNLVAPEAPAGRQVEVTPAIAPPQRPVGRVDAPAGWAMIARNRHRHGSQSARGKLNSTPAASVLSDKPACTTTAGRFLQKEMDIKRKWTWPGQRSRQTTTRSANGRRPAAGARLPSARRRRKT